MIEQAATILAGFSIVCAGLVLAAGFTIDRFAAQGVWSRARGAVLVLSLAGLQLLHWQRFADGADLAGSKLYVVLLYVAASSFFLFFRGALLPQAKESPWPMAWFATAFIGAVVSPAIAMPLAFVLGVGFAARLATLVHRLRAQRARFRVEFATFVAHALVAAAILVLGVLSPWIGIDTFFLAYAILIGLAFGLAVYLLLRFPDIAGKAADAVASAYAVSTLARVDSDRIVARLSRMMDDEQAYTDESLNLSRLAKALGLSPHQLSELVNTRFGVGFSRFVREHRVAAAQRMLLAEPDASVLSVGLAVGFTSQSNFYAAFREITGDVPGRYRQNHAASP